MLKSKFSAEPKEVKEEFPCLKQAPDGTIYLMATETKGTVVCESKTGYPLGRRILNLEPMYLSAVKGTITLEGL